MVSWNTKLGIGLGLLRAISAFRGHSLSRASTATQLISNKHFVLSHHQYQLRKSDNLNSVLSTKRQMSEFSECSKSSSSSSSCNPGGYVDVHAHLIHEQFNEDVDAIANKCSEFGLEYVICNGLEPVSNRATLELAGRYPHILPALGIYPLDAACNFIVEGENWKHPFPPPTRFDVDEEIRFIDSLAAEKKIVALGECGLDKHYLTDEVSFAEQERVLRLLMRVAKKHDLPIILHTRKAEARVLELLIEEGVTKADFHCFCGKAKLGQQIAEAGYYLSIPSCVENNSQFKKLVEVLPFNRILTETDCPYMGPDKGQRNDPSTVVRGSAAIAKVKGCSPEEARDIIRSNFRTLFGL